MREREMSIVWSSQLIYLTGAETELGWVARPLNEGRESLAGLKTHLN